MSRLQRIEIRDFQSLSDVALDVDGLTVIVGATNAGKSAVVRALEAALFNRTGGGFVREGSTQASVRLGFDGGGLLWTKPRKGGARYDLSVDGVNAIVTRVGKEMPEEIDALTGVREIECEGVRAKLQIDAQFDEPFLLASTGGQAAKLMARVCRLDVLVTAQVRARRDGERMRRDAESASERAEELGVRLDALPDFEALEARWTSADDRLTAARERETKLEVARRLVAERRRLSALHSLWSAAGLTERVSKLQARSRELETTAQVVGRARAAREERDLAVQLLDGGRRTLEITEQELHETLGGLDICPICNRPMH